MVCSLGSITNSGSLPQSSKLLNMGTETNKTERNTPEYLAQLLKDKKQIQAFPNVFLHLERLLDEGKLVNFTHSVTIFWDFLVSDVVKLWK